MSNDGLVQVQPDSTGAKIDTSEITRSDGTLVDRQRMVLSDPQEPRTHQTVSGEQGRGASYVSDKEALDLLREILETLDDIKTMMMEML